MSSTIDESGGIKPAEGQGIGKRQCVPRSVPSPTFTLLEKRVSLRESRIRVPVISINPVFRRDAVGVVKIPGKRVK
jgi:hypothetical protein